MQKNTESRNRKRFGATASAIVILIPAALIICFGKYLLRFTAGEGILINGFLWVYILAGAAVGIGVAAVLWQRWREIKGGEEEEASKY
ncbi:MAG: hypothetical protein HFE73_01355 [Firmicutes bacterium]|nr:hypothetical protein [Bacillota bacterium]